MLVFTYCSCRSSRYGYQYSAFSSDSTNAELSIFASELSEKKHISKVFSEWCEDRNGWQLVVLHNKKNDKYWLMAGQLEKSRELEKKIQIKRGNTSLDMNSLDSDYYMSLGFLGSTEEIKKIAVFMLKEYKKDGYRDLFNRLEKTIRKTEDASRYEINTELFNSIFNNIPDVILSSEDTDVSSVNSKFGKMIRKVVSSDTYLSLVKSKKKNETKSSRQKNVEKCIGILSKFDNLSGSIPLLIAYDYFSIDAKIDVRIDYEYLWCY